MPDPTHGNNVDPGRSRSAVLAVYSIDFFLDNRGNPDGVGGEVCLQVQRARPPGIHVFWILVLKTRSPKRKFGYQKSKSEYWFRAEKHFLWKF